MTGMAMLSSRAGVCPETSRRWCRLAPGNFHDGAVTLAALAEQVWREVMARGGGALGGEC